MNPQATQMEMADGVKFIQDLPRIQDVYDTDRSARFLEEMSASRISEKKRRIMVEVYATLTSGDWERLTGGMDHHDMQMLIYALQYNPDLIPDVSPHVDAMLAKHDPTGSLGGLWNYIRGLKPPIAA